MRSLEGTLTFHRGRSFRSGFQPGLTTHLAPGAQAPAAFIPEATDIARRYAKKIDGVEVSMVTETVLGIPSTAHILGGACIGRNADEGVIDDKHEVFGHPGLYVIDGAAVSANPGVNPSLSITAMAERAMAQVAAR
jgi:cholesterol oxidase